MTSKVIQGHKQWSFYLKIYFFFCLCYWLIKETNAAEYYESTKLDLKDTQRNTQKAALNGDLFKYLLYKYLHIRLDFR